MSSKRDQLLDAALELFNERGFAGTGIDAILVRAGVAKMTLYKHFGSKDELVLATLRRADERWRRWMAGEVEARATAPRERLLAVFDFAGTWFARPEFRGCLFARASGEFTEGDDPVRAACVEHNRLIERYLRGLAEQAGAPDAESLARELTLLFLGAMSAAQASGDADPASTARRAAATLVSAHFAGPAGERPHEPGRQRAG
jgi:AcrR family transcriptional regulator